MSVRSGASTSRMKRSKRHIDQVRRRKSLSISRHEAKIMDSIKRLSHNEFGNKSSRSRRNRYQTSQIQETSDLNLNTFEDCYRSAKSFVMLKQIQLRIGQFYEIFITDYDLLDDCVSMTSNVLLLFIFLSFLVIFGFKLTFQAVISIFQPPKKSRRKSGKSKLKKRRSKNKKRRSLLRRRRRKSTPR